MTDQSSDQVSADSLDETPDVVAQPLKLLQPETFDSTQHNDVAATGTSTHVSRPSLFYFVPLFYSFLCMGFGTGITTSTLLRIGEQTNSNVARLTFIFFSRSCGVFIGAMLAGAFIDRFPRFGYTLLTIAVLLMSATVVSVPFIHYLPFLIPFQLAWGLGAGTIENISQVLTLRFYSQYNVGPYLQTLHSGFGIGTVISPLIVAYFVSEKSGRTHWHYAYFIVFLLHLPNLLWLFWYTFRNELCNQPKSNTMPTSGQDAEHFLSTDKRASVDVIGAQKKQPVTFRVLFFIILFFFFYIGGQYAFISYLNTYAVLHLSFSKDIAAYLNSVFSAFFVIGRLCGIPLSIKLKPQTMIFGDLAGCLIALLLLLIMNRSSHILWIGSIMFGFFIASIYSSETTYIEKYVKVTGKILSVFTVASASGDALLPLLVGKTIELTLFGFPAFITVILAIFIFTSVLFIVQVQCLSTFSSSVHKDHQSSYREDFY